MRDGPLEGTAPRAGARVRVLVVDDSPLARDLLAGVLSRDAGLEIVGEAADGAEAVERVLALRPDVVTMDLKMPRMDGIEATRAIMARRPTPILVVTGHPFQSGRDMTFEALSAGAVDLVVKPELGTAGEAGGAAEDLARLVRCVAGASVAPVPAAPSVRADVLRGRRPPVSVVAIASSVGGPRAVHALLSGLPAGFPAGILVAQHIAEGYSRELAAWLDGDTALTVRQAQDGDVVRPGLVLVAPAEASLRVGPGGACRLVRAAAVGRPHPSGDLLLASVARQYGEATCGIVLSGMGDDGVEGLSEVRARGGVTLAQDEATSAVYGMARAAVERGVVDAVLPLERLSDALLMLCPMRQAEGA